jgi:hypothetical protein
VLAWSPGTRDVTNGLEEVPPREDKDDEITDAVSLILEKTLSLMPVKSVSAREIALSL